MASPSLFVTDVTGDSLEAGSSLAGKVILGEPWRHDLNTVMHFLDVVQSLDTERTREGSSQPTETFKWHLALIMFLAIAFALRVFHLGNENLWLDEVASVGISSRPLVRVLAAETTNPPLYYLLLHFWMKLFGNSEASVRLLSLGPSLAAIVLTYYLAHKLFDCRVGIVAAAFMSLSPYQISYAQEARAFALLLFLSLASTTSLYIALGRSADRRTFLVWFSYVVFAIASLYTHYHAVFVIIAQNVLFMLFYWRADLRALARWVLIQALIIVAFMPQLIIMLQAAAGGVYVRRYLILKLPQAVFSFLAGDTVVPFDETAVQNIAETLSDSAILIAAFCVGFGVYFLSTLRATAWRPNASTFCATMFFVPLIVPFLISFKVSIFDARYVIAATPFLYILLAHGVVYLHDLAIRRSKPALGAHFLAGSLVLATLGIGLYNYYFNQRFGKEQWLSVVNLIESNHAPGDIIVFDPGYIKGSYGYYSKRNDPYILLNKPLNDQSAAATKSRVTLYQHHRLWLVQSHFFHDETLPTLLHNFVMISRTHFPKAKGIDVYLLERSESLEPRT